MADHFYLPYLINYAQPVAEDIIIICLGFCTAILVSAEGQGFVATMLGDAKVGAKDRLHFNVFLHLSLLGTLCFFVAGFGWAKPIKIDTDNFKKHPRLYLFLSRMAGPVANLLLANIAASMSWILTNFGIVDKVFSTIVLVNITMAVYSLIPLLPLPGGVIWQLFSYGRNDRQKLWQMLLKVGPFVIIGVFLAIRLSGYEGLALLVNPLVLYLTNFSLDI